MNVEEPTPTSEDAQAHYTSAEARQVLGVSRQRIHQLLNDGLLKGYRDEKSGRWLIERGSVISYARSRTVVHHHPRLQALEAEVQRLLQRLGQAESRITVLDGDRRQRELMADELGLIRDELSQLRQELLRLGEYLRKAL